MANLKREFSSKRNKNEYHWSSILELVSRITYHRLLIELRVAYKLRPFTYLYEVYVQ